MSTTAPRHAVVLYIKLLDILFANDYHATLKNETPKEKWWLLPLNERTFPKYITKPPYESIQILPNFRKKNNVTNNTFQSSNANENTISTPSISFISPYTSAQMCVGEKTFNPVYANPKPSVPIVIAVNNAALSCS